MSTESVDALVGEWDKARQAVEDAVATEERTARVNNAAINALNDARKAEAAAWAALEQYRKTNRLAVTR